MIQLHQLYQKDPQIVYRQIAGESILVPIRPNADDLDSIYTLNETGARIWVLLDGQHSLNDIVNEIIVEFDVDPEQVEQDLVELIRDLESIGAVVKA